MFDDLAIKLNGAQSDFGKADSAPEELPQKLLPPIPAFNPTYLTATSST